MGPRKRLTANTVAEAPRSGLEGRIQSRSSRPQRASSAPFCECNEYGIIAADIGFLLRSRPPLDATLGRRRIGDSRVVFGAHQPHGAAAKRVATLVGHVTFADLRHRVPSAGFLRRRELTRSGSCGLSSSGRAALSCRACRSGGEGTLPRNRSTAGILGARDAFGRRRSIPPRSQAQAPRSA